MVQPSSVAGGDLFRSSLSRLRRDFSSLITPSRRLVACALAALLAAGCATTGSVTPSAKTAAAIIYPATAAEELDLIYTMLANAVVYKQWQTKGPNARGYNIGSVLVDPNGNVVNWAVNCVDVLTSGTQHGEVRLMLGYQIKNKVFELQNYTIYTTLEPCAQCSGMMTLQSVARTVYCQHDTGFGDALQRLQFDSSRIGGYKPYPRPVIPLESPSKYAQQLDQLYAASGGKFITDFLFTDPAKGVFMQSSNDLQNYQPRFPQNAAKLQGALALLAQAPDHFVPLGISL